MESKIKDTWRRIKSISHTSRFKHSYTINYKINDKQLTTFEIICTSRISNKKLGQIDDHFFEFQNRLCDKKNWYMFLLAYSDSSSSSLRSVKSSIMLVGPVCLLVAFISSISIRNNGSQTTLSARNNFGQPGIKCEI